MLRKRVFPALVALGLMAGWGAYAVPEALACGGFFCSARPMNQAGERILFVQDGEDQVAYVQIQYSGAAEKFAWVVPVPSEPKLGVGSDQLFSSLMSTTQPLFQLNRKTEGECEPSPVRAAQPAGAADSVGNNGVSVISQNQVGPYDSAVLQSNDPQALKTWLRENDYDIPQTLDPLLDPYVSGKYYFVALKLQQDRTTGDLQPIVLRYAAPKPGVPIRLTGVAATPDMDVFVWVLGDHRAIPENYRHAEINEARIDWLTGGSNYRAVVTEAMDEAGGQAFVTDYAGKSSVVPLNVFDTARFDLEALKTKTEPVAFAQELIRQGYFRNAFNGVGAQAQSFLQRYIPNPDPETVPDSYLYSALSGGATTAYLQNGNQLGLTQFFAQHQTTVDTEKAAAELQETVIGPYEQIHQLFGEHPYMTRLYTTLSPAEMTQDPTFLFNPDLPDVDNVHQAEGVVECSSGVTYANAPIRITLENGLSFYARRATPGAATGTPVAMPAAARIEQLKTSGAPALIQNNESQIKKAIASLNDQGSAIAVNTTTGAAGAAGTSTAVATPRVGSSGAGAGFGCSSCAPTNRAPVPISQVMGEGIAYGAVFLGFLGYRRWRRK